MIRRKHFDASLCNDVQSIARIAGSEHKLAGTEPARVNAGQHGLNVLRRQMSQEIAFRQQPN